MERLKFQPHPADSMTMNDKQTLIWEVLYWLEIVKPELSESDDLARP